MREKKLNPGHIILDNVKHAVGVIQIVPDIGADIHQYDCFATFLNKHGYIVSYGDAHNTSASSDDIFMTNVNKQIRSLKYIAKQYDLPVFLFGHGYSSFIIQRIMEKSNTCAAGACLADGFLYPAWYLNLGRMIAWAGMRLRGSNAPAKYFTHFSPICKRICGMNLSYGFYYSLFRNLREITYHTDCDTPLLIISGGADLVGNNANLSTVLYKTYQSHNMENLTIIIYPGLLTKTDCPNIQHDILDFFNSIQCPQTQG